MSVMYTLHDKCGKIEGVAKIAPIDEDGSKNTWVKAKDKTEYATAVKNIKKK